MITINQQPVNRWSAAFSPIAFTLTSTNSGQSQFSFVCDVYHYPGSVKTLLGRLRAPAITGVGLFDISGLLQSTLDPIPNLQFGFTDCTSFYGQWSVEFYEEFDTTGGTGFPVVDIASLITVADSTNSQPSSYFYAAADDFLSSQSGGSAMKFLLGNPRDRQKNLSGIRIREDEKACLVWLRPDLGAIPRRLKVERYGLNGLLLGSKTFTTSIVPSTSYKVWSVGIGPSQINEYGLVEGDTTPFIHSGVGHYIVNLVTTGATVASEGIRYDIDRSPVKQSRRLHWLNRFGGIDSASFTYSENYESTRDTYNISSRQLNGTSYDLRSTDSSLFQTSTPKASGEYVSFAQNERGYNSLKGLAISPRIWQSEPSRVWTVNDISGGFAGITEDYTSINNTDNDLAGTSWWWQNQTARGFAVVNTVGVPTGYVGLTGMTSGSCLYEMEWNQRSLKRIAVTSFNWISPKDRQYKLNLKADLPSPESQWQ